MKILMVSSYLPYPLTSGGHIRLYNILKILSKNHQIILVCEKRSYQSEKDIAEVKKFCKEIVVVDRKKQWTLKNILKTGFSKYPFLVTGHTNLKMKREISKLLKKEKFDLIHVETFYVMQNLPDEISIPVILTEHNIEYLVYKRFRDETPFYAKALLDIDILKLKKIEEKSWRKANVVVSVSSEDKKVIEDVNNRVFIVPNGVDLQKFKIQNLKFKIDDRERTVLFIGDFKWVENRDAARMILKDIWPEVKLKIENLQFSVKLWVVGKKIPENLKKLGTGEVVFDENAPSNTSKIYEKVDLLLAPIRIGGGTSFKILEAMASGVPVITTRLGAIGIGATDREEVIIAESKEESSDNLAELLKDNNLYEKIAKNARILVEKKYNWENVVKDLEKIYSSAV